ncbi:glycosyltransferase family 2 protein [Paenibacillus sp. IHBB 10380]|uniref:glycosyltransferase family 2 protein n=1 Tax=Paenibacillus sp. IHBB 10380 TaxID=1566358 RepID=UPI0005CFC7EA|nr:glycosyltransferase family 2 protein [Paenibacillus sp. IHBB 10380]AJS59929.1 glycosyl transferase [Paenibacillus sp. IHBB 10380]
MNQPLISIVMPTYNRANVISASIQSILEQTYTHWELIVVDDRSTDNTKEVVEQFVRQDARINYVVNDRSKGPGGARNFGMLNAKGELLSFLDSDDQWYKYHLQDSLDVLHRTKADISFALWVEKHGPETVHNFDNKVEQQLISKMREINTFHPDAILFDEGLFEQFLLHTRNFFQLNTMLFKRELLQTFRLFNEELYLGEDTTFLIQFFDRCKIALITKPHSIYNQSPDSLYFFCNRWQLDPDMLHTNREVMEKLEALAHKSIQVRTLIRNRVEHANNLKSKRRCLQNIDIGIASKYFTLSYINRLDRGKALSYCRSSLKSKVTIFNFLLWLRLFLSIKGGSGFLKKALNLW